MNPKEIEQPGTYGVGSSEANDDELSPLFMGCKRVAVLSQRIDSIQWSWSVDWGANGFWSVMENLETMKKQAQNYGHSGFEFTLADGLTLNIMSRGQGRWSYWLETAVGSMRICRLQGALDMPNVLLEPTGRALWDLWRDEGDPLRDVVDYYGTVVQAMGGRVIGEWVRRLDVATDFKRKNTDGFSLEALDGSLVTRLRNTDVRRGEGGRIETYYVGKVGVSPVLLRLYDKSQQLKASTVPGEPPASHNWRAWGLAPGTKGVWRAEFEIGKEVLRQFGITTLADVSAKWDAVNKSLAQNTVSFRQLDGVKKNKERKPYTDWWDAVVNYQAPWTLAEVEREKKVHKPADEIWAGEHFLNAFGLYMSCLDCAGKTEGEILDLAAGFLKTAANGRYGVFAEFAGEKDYLVKSGIEVMVESRIEGRLRRDEKFRRWRDESYDIKRQLAERDDEW